MTYPSNGDVVNSLETFNITWSTNATDGQMTRLFFKGGSLKEPEWISDGTEYKLSGEFAMVAPLGKSVPPANDYVIYFVMPGDTRSFSYSNYFSVNKGTKTMPSSGSSPTTSPTNSQTKPATVTATSSANLSPGAKVGIGIGVGLGVPILGALAGVLFFLYRRQRPAPSPPPTTQQDPSFFADEASHPGVPPDQYYYTPPPPGSEYPITEQGVWEQPKPVEASELGGSTPTIHEMPATTHGV